MNRTVATLSTLLSLMKWRDQYALLPLSRN